jgi:hypothetical protein
MPPTIPPREPWPAVAAPKPFAEPGAAFEAEAP